MTRGSNRRLLAGLLVGAAAAVVIESGVVFGFVGATASMGAIVLVCFVAAAGYGVSKVVQRRQVLRGKTVKRRPVTDRDKKVIMAHIDDLLASCRERETQSRTQSGPISEEDKKTIMGHIDLLLEAGREPSGGAPK